MSASYYLGSYLKVTSPYPLIKSSVDLLKRYFGIIVLPVDKFLYPEYIDPEMASDSIKQLDCMILRKSSCAKSGPFSPPSSLPRLMGGGNIIRECLGLSEYIRAVFLSILSSWTSVVL